jgi:hypothetical protein
VVTQLTAWPKNARLDIECTIQAEQDVYLAISGHLSMSDDVSRCKDLLAHGVVSRSREQRMRTVCLRQTGPNKTRTGTLGGGGGGGGCGSVCVRRERGHIPRFVRYGPSYGRIVRRRDDSDSPAITSGRQISLKSDRLRPLYDPACVRVCRTGRDGLRHIRRLAMPWR